MIKKLTLLSFLLTVAFGLKAQTDEPCTATALTVYSSCALVDTTQGAINPAAFTRSTNASAGVTLPTLTCNGFATTTRDFWYKCVVPASGSIVVDVSYGSNDAISSPLWDMAVYRSNSATCAGSTFTLLGKECLTNNFPRAKFSGLTVGSTVYIRLWLEAAEAQTDPASFGIFVVNGNVSQPATCATLTSPINGVVLKDDPFVVWNITDPLAQLYDVYYGKTSTLATMNVVSGLQPATTTQTQLAYPLNHGDSYGTAPDDVLIQPNAINYWFVQQKNCATDPALVPNCTRATYTAAPVPTNDNCAGAILLSKDGDSETHSSASSTESTTAETCSMGATAAADVWFKFRTNSVASPSVSITVSTFIMDAIVEVFSGTCGALTSVKCEDKVADLADEIMNLTDLAPNTTYYIRVYNYDANGYLYGEEFDIAITGNIVIPVELVDFTAKTQAAKNALNWQTASERNAQSFTVERSADGEKGFTAIGTVKAAGTTSTPQYYAFMDVNPLPVSYYRLRQTDFDGKSDVSKIVTVQRKDKRLALEKAFPMPATNELTVQYSAERAGSVSLQLVDVLGRLILAQNVAATEGGNVVRLALDNVATGAYVLLLSDGLKVSQMRIVKQ